MYIIVLILKIYQDHLPNSILTEDTPFFIYRFNFDFGRTIRELNAVLDCVTITLKTLEECLQRYNKNEIPEPSLVTKIDADLNRFCKNLDELMEEQCRLLQQFAGDLESAKNEDSKQMDDIECIIRLAVNSFVFEVDVKAALSCSSDGKPSIDVVKQQVIEILGIIGKYVQDDTGETGEIQQQLEKLRSAVNYGKVIEDVIPIITYLLSTIDQVRETGQVKLRKRNTIGL